MSTIGSFKMEVLIPATFTPMNKDGSVNYDRIKDYAKYLSDNDFKQIYLNGTTGEGFSLTLDERKKILETWIKVGRDSGLLKSIVVHVGALNVHDTISLAEHAVKAGADAIGCVPPLFFKPQTVAYLVKYCKEVAAAAPKLPFYFYHIPSATGVELNMENFLTEAVKEIPNLVGIKFSSKDLVDMIGCVNVHAPHRDNKRLNAQYGCDEKIMAGLVMGADGGVGSTYNFMPASVRRIVKNTMEGKFVEARVDQYRVQQTCRVMYKYGDLLGNNVASLKAIMTMIGLDLGPSRSPLRPPTDEEHKAFRAELETIGFFKWCKDIPA